MSAILTAWAAHETKMRALGVPQEEIITIKAAFILGVLAWNTILWEAGEDEARRAVLRDDLRALSFAAMEPMGKGVM